MAHSTTDKHYQKTGPKCPECNGKTVMLIYPHPEAGQYECQNKACGLIEYCEHPETIVETVEVDTMRNGEYDSYLTQVESCANCGVQVGV